MSIKSFTATLFAAILLISCNSSTFIEVETGDSLALQNFTIVDYDFTTANQNGNELLFFEFVSSQELEATTTATFTDQSGSIISRSEIGDTVNEVGEINGISETRSYVYSVSLGEIRSLSLIYGVELGN